MDVDREVDEVLNAFFAGAIWYESYSGRWGFQPGGAWRDMRAAARYYTDHLEEAAKQDRRLDVFNEIMDLPTRREEAATIEAMWRQFGEDS